MEFFPIYYFVVEIVFWNLFFLIIRNLTTLALWCIIILTFRPIKRTRTFFGYVRHRTYIRKH